MKNVIIKVLKGSIAEKLKIKSGDQLIAVNGCKIQDYIDYKFQISDENILVKIMRQDGSSCEFEIEKQYDEDLGIVFENPLMDNIKVCSNKCVFCFIDQMPKGMRKTLYLKDDDTRLSFLYGNFITLTNLSDDEINRIIKYRISPIKVSVHATDLGLRNFMMGNNKGKDILMYLKKLAKAHITVDCQIVLCRGLNDGDVLSKTISDLAKLHPYVRSAAIVPVGLTKYRDNLYDLKGFDTDSSRRVVSQVSAMQRELYSKYKTRFVFIADEFYLLAGKEFPPYKYYEKFDQLENGIGLYRMLEREIEHGLPHFKNNKPSAKEYTIVTGTAAYKLMINIANKIMDEIDIKINVEQIVNNFFGHQITVAGLVTGGDIIEQLKNKNCKNLIIPRCMLNDESGVFLDDVTVEKLKEELNTEVYVSETSGKSLLKTIVK